MEKVNVYSVPGGYFESLPDLLLSVCKVEDLSFSVPAPRQIVQDVPAGYFDSLADDIMSRIRSAKNQTASDELKELSPVIAGIPNTNVYQVPQGYFDTVADSVMNSINADQQTASEELRALSPMLYSIQNENVYELPRGYFSGLAEEILDKVRPAKVVPMKKRSFNFVKYAVAAVFTGAMAFGVMKFAGNSNKTTSTDFADVTKFSKVDVEGELAKISDDEIVNYLEASGTDVKTALVANSVDENQLPSQEEYLLDEQALDKYLNSINVNDLKN